MQHQEIEQKYRVLDIEALRLKLQTLPKELPLDEPQVIVDSYFHHNLQSGLTVRLRTIKPLLQVPSNEPFSCEAEHKVTVKRNKSGIATTTFVREELEEYLSPSLFEIFKAMHEAYGMSPVCQVSKVRQTAFMVVPRNDMQDFGVEVCIDQVEGLGNFVELEFIGSIEDPDEATRILDASASMLGLNPDDRMTKGYATMVLEQLSQVPGMSAGTGVDPNVIPDDPNGADLPKE